VFKTIQKQLFTAFNLNRLVFAVSSSGLILNFFWIFSLDFKSGFGSNQILRSLILLLSNALWLHILFNITHLSSHMMLGKKFWTNRLVGDLASFFGGITFSDFYTTHLLHHANQGNPAKDPDYWITRSGSIWSIPFKIMYHDLWFWKNNLYQKKFLWLDYVVTRTLQVVLVSWFVLTSQIWVFVIFWLVPMAIVGYLNSLFLFYYPHYTTKLETYFKQQDNPNLFGKTLLGAIDISRVSHEIHHDKVRNNQVYYPITWAFMNVLSGSWNKIKSEAKLKYTEFETP
jgi:fatty acid desaturase